MNLFYKNLPPSSNKPYLITIGVFDGVHLGHQYLLKKLKAEAEKRNMPALVVSFDFPPEKILHPSKRFTGQITDYQQKTSLIQDLGIDFLWILSLNKGLLKFSAEQFLAHINSYFPIGAIFAGSDFRFGFKAGAGSKKLKEFSSEYGFDLKIIPKKKFSGTLLSSSLLKELIKKGEFKKAKKFLGRDYVVKGLVEKGKGLGRKIGFPTANLNTFDYVLPPQGVYAAYAKIGRRYFLSAVNLGRGGFEVHLINFSKNILDQTIEVTLLKKLRNELKFQSQAELAKYIQKDIQAVTAKYSVPSG